MNPTAGGQAKWNPLFRRCAAPVAWASVVAYAVTAGLTVWFGVRSHALHASADVGLVSWNAINVLVGIVFSTFVVAGAFIVSRRPRNTVGWIMVVGGLAFAARGLADTYTLVAIGASPAEPSVLGLIARLSGTALVRIGAALLLVFLPLVYPDGRLPSHRWRPFARATWIFTALWTVSGISAERLTGSAFPLGREPIEIYDVANPLATSWLRSITGLISGSAEVVILLGLTITAIGAVVVRFRASRGIEREQMKWFAFAAGLYVTLFSLSIVAGLALEASPWLVQNLQGLAYLSFMAYPVAVGVAVLRYRLYEIDRIISRTVSYGLVVAILGGVYVATVVGLGAAATAVTGVRDSDLVVAVSTLLAAGLFRPVRTRVRSVVDRRFNRTGYEARQAVDAFSRQVRDEVDLPRIRRQIVHTAATAVQPAHASIWPAHESDDAS